MIDLVDGHSSAGMTVLINALPAPLRRYVHDLETNADPAGDKIRLLILEENNIALIARVERCQVSLKRIAGNNPDAFQWWVQEAMAALEDTI